MSLTTKKSLFEDSLQLCTIHPSIHLNLHYIIYHHTLNLLTFRAWSKIHLLTQVIAKVIQGCV